MYDSDREFLSRFVLDPSMEYGWEELSTSDLIYDEALDPCDDENILDAEELMPENNFLLMNEPQRRC